MFGYALKHIQEKAHMFLYIFGCSYISYTCAAISAPCRNPLFTEVALPDSN